MPQLFRVDKEDRFGDEEWQSMIPDATRPCVQGALSHAMGTRYRGAIRSTTNSGAGND